MRATETPFAFSSMQLKNEGRKGKKKKREKGGAFTLTPGADSIPSLHRRPALHAGEAQIRSRSIVSLRRALSKQNPDRFPFFNSQAVGSLSFPGQFFGSEIEFIAIVRSKK